MTRAHAVLAGLLVLALAWAFALTRPEWWPVSGVDRPIPLWTLEAKDIVRVEFVDGASKVVLKNDPAVRMADGSPGVWIEADGPYADADVPSAANPSPPGAKPGAPTPRRGRPRRPGALLDQPRAMLVSTETSPAANSNEKPASTPVTHIALRGGTFATHIVRELGHMTALRDLGRPTDAQRASFGLTKPQATLRIERTGGDPLILEFGNTSAGAGTRYGMLRSGDRAYLVNLGVLRNLEHPRRLMDREWVPFALTDAKRIEAKIGDKTLTAYQLDLPRGEAQRWARTAGAAKGEPELLKWVQALMGVKVLDYGAASEVLATKDLLAQITVTPSEPKAAANAPGAPVPASQEPVTLRVFKPSSKTAQKTRAVSGYTGSPVDLSLPSVQAVLDQARPLLNSK